MLVEEGAVDAGVQQQLLGGVVAVEGSEDVDRVAMKFDRSPHKAWYNLLIPSLAVNWQSVP